MDNIFRNAVEDTNFDSYYLKVLSVLIVRASFSYSGLYIEVNSMLFEYFK